MTFLAAMALLGALVVLGLGTSFLVRRRPVDLVELLFESSVFGFLYVIVGGTVLLRLGHFTRPAFVVCGAIIAVGTLIAARRHLHKPLVDGHVAWFLIVLMPVALLLRLPPVYFALLIGDMGEYVTNANRMAGGWELTGSFPHGFSVLLGFAATVLGTQYTVVIVPAMGLVVLAGIFVLARAISPGSLPMWVATLVVAVHPLGIWFARFPVSESAYAVTVVALLYAMLLVIRSRSVPHAVLAGLLVGTMVHTRGDALIVAALVIGVALGLLLLDRSRHRVAWVLLLSAVGSAAVAWAYNVRFPHVYFVEFQLSRFVPGRVFSALDRAGAFELGWRLLALVVAAAVGLTALGVVTQMIGGRVRSRHKPVVTMAVFVGVLGVLALSVLVVGTGGLRNALPRWGVVLPLSAIGMVAVVLRQKHDRMALWWLFVLSLAATSILLFAYRFDAPRSHEHLFYWDRYLVGDAFLVAVILAAVAVGAALSWLVNDRVRPLVRASLVCLVTPVLAVMVGWSLVQSYEISRNTMFGDVPGLLTELDEVTRVRGPGPIVYSGSEELPEGWVVGNTHRAFALPLGIWAERAVLRIPSNPFAPDDVYSPVEARALLDEHGGGYVLVLGAATEAMYSEDGCFDEVGRVSRTLPVITRSSEWRKISRYRYVELEFVAYHLGGDCVTM